jgi:hypothetical protein
VSIGHELLINPSLMLLDEPTSGLDSTTALRILTTLDELAQGGRTVITTIHQPSSKMFLMFDKLLLLADGSPLYYGAASDAMAYFAQRGYTPKYATNPADYLLDLATGEVADGPENAQAVKEELTTAYSQTRGPLELQRLNSLPMASAEDQARSVGKKTWPTSWLEQFALLTLRGIKERRFEALGGLRFVQIVAISVICGCLWFNSKQRTAADIADQTGILFFESTFWGFFPLFTALFTFPQERQMLNKERAVGMYRLTAYFFARTVGDMPLELIMPFVFTIIVYWMADLKHSFVAYILHLLTLLLAVLVSQSLGLLVGATVMDLKKATTLASVIMLAFLLTGGYFVRQIPVWIRWLKYLSFPYYTFRLLLKIQYDTDALYECPGETPSGLCLIQYAPALHGVPLGGGGIEAMALFIMLVGYRFFAYAALRTLNKGTK